MSRELTSYRRKYLILAISDSRRRIKAQAVAYKGGKCERCGYAGCAAAFDFHHTNPEEKDFKISGSSRSFARVKVELDKTVLLCARCHREVHDEWNLAALQARRQLFEALPKPSPGRPQQLNAVPASVKRITLAMLSARKGSEG